MPDKLSARQAAEMTDVRALRKRSPRGHTSRMKSKRATDLLAGFAARLERARIARGIVTQAELAALVGVSPDTVTKWEGGRNYPRAPELYMLTQVLDVSSDWLLFDNLRGMSPEAIKRVNNKQR
jgi:DNA-binding transcriptional regulator YiaG